MHPVTNSELKIFSSFIYIHGHVTGPVGHLFLKSRFVMYFLLSSCVTLFTIINYDNPKLDRIWLSLSQAHTL